MAQSAPVIKHRAGTAYYDGGSVHSEGRNPANRGHKPRCLLDELTARGQISLSERESVERALEQRPGDISEIVLQRRLASEQQVAEAAGAIHGAQCVDLVANPPDRTLLSEFSPTEALKHGVIPWRRAGRATLVAAPSKLKFDAALPVLKKHCDTPRFVIAPKSEIECAIIRGHSVELTARAEERVEPIDSCRTLAFTPSATFGLTLLAALILCVCMNPLGLYAVLTSIAVFTLAATLALKLAAAGATILPNRRDQQDALIDMPATSGLPKVSILVPLFKERDIASHLIARLGKLNYPRDLLEVLLVTESDDFTTKATISEVSLPHWMRQVVVPPGQLKTKPRALNFALDLCHGEIIGVYDAEDAPEPDQLLKVASAFSNATPNVACLQGKLDYYNPAANWMARCFTLEYATWFRVILPGLSRLRLPLPLGGTTLFLRTAILRELGAWDAHNVTEDADLGVRLARRGYRTELIDTVTYEEANCRIWPWIRQRSRWLKGYAITYAVHMRNPRALLHDLGLWQFLGIQVLFAGTLSQFILAPVLWSFWLFIFGYGASITATLSASSLTAVIAFMTLAEIAGLAVATLGATRTKHRHLWRWTPLLMIYFSFGAFAAMKALYELFGRPYYWDKTSHGISAPDADRHFAMSLIR